MEQNGEEMPQSENLSEEIDKLYESDQLDRQLLSDKNFTGSLEEIGLRDENRLQNAHNLLKHNKVTNPHDLHKLAFIFQHGGKIDDIAKALEISEQAVAHGLPPQYSLIPHATDRLMVYKQKIQGIPISEIKQKYGTQYTLDEQGNTIQYKVDGSATPEELEKFGLQHETNSVG